MLLGIDQGTTGTRACLVGANGRIEMQAYAAHAQIRARAGWVEHDPAEIWACTQRVIGEVLARGSERPTGVALANQGETIMIWDRRSGRPLHNALVWQDTRTQAFVDQLASDPDLEARVRAETGLRLDPYFSAPKLRWLLDEVPEARGLATAGHLRAGTLDTWLIDRLTDGAVFATDVSTAARTLLCETVTHKWSRELLDAFGIPKNILPEIRASDGGFGTCVGNGLDGVPILASLVDQPAALAGHGCIDWGDAKATFGTGCFVYVNAGAMRPEKPDGTLATVAWQRAAQSSDAGPTTCYALDGGVLAVGSALGWLRDVGLLDSDDALDAALTTPRGDASVICVPALVGLGAPHWNRAARGAWLGMSSATTRTDLVAALAEGLACRVVEVVRSIERDTSIGVRELRADGGLTRSTAFMQLVADLLGRPLAVAEEDEATVVGACAIAALRSGELSLDELRARRTRFRARYEPKIATSMRNARLDRFAAARALIARWR